MTKAVVLSLFLFLIGAAVLATLRAISPETINLVESVEITQTVTIGEPERQVAALPKGVMVEIECVAISS